MNEFISLVLAFHFVLLLVYKLGKTLPIRELAAFTYTLQILIGALLTYKFYPHTPVGFMTVREETYYPYALPCVLVFILGLYFPPFKYTSFRLSTILDSNKIGNAINKEEWSKLGVQIVIASFVVQVISSFFPSDGLSFFYTLFSYFRYVGIYYLWVGKYKYRYVFFAIVFIPFIATSLAGGLFIEMFIWSFLTFAAIQLPKPRSFRVNILVFAGGLFMMFLMQSVKLDFRKVAWKEGNTMSVTERIGYFASLATNFDLGDSKTRDLANMHFIIRINEGFILSNIMKNMPARQPFVDGKYFKDELEGIFVPRFLVPDKAVVGSHEKFEKFAGWKLDRNVAMAVSILGDGYGNFGYWGGIIFCFLNGLLLNFLLHLCAKIANEREKSLVLWMPVIFTFSVRCGDEFYIITNHIVKSSILIFIIFYFLKRTGTLSRLSNTKPLSQ